MTGMQVSSPATRRDERGNALMMVLITIIIVAVTFTALLSFETATSRAQTALTTKRQYDLAGDGGIDQAIAKLSTDPQMGVTTNPQSPTDTPCKNFTSLPVDANLSVNSDGTGTAPDDTDVTVPCAADPSSGTPGGNAGDAADAVITTLGGAYGDGNDNGESPDPHIP